MGSIHLNRLDLKARLQLICIILSEMRAYFGEIDPLKLEVTYLVA